MGSSELVMGADWASGPDTSAAVLMQRKGDRIYMLAAWCPAPEAMMELLREVEDGG